MNVQCRGQDVDVLERDVPLAALNRTDIGPVQPGQISQGLLREASLEAQRAQCPPECEAVVGLGSMLRHGRRRLCAVDAYTSTDYK